MKKISFWGRQHPRLTRIVIASSLILLCLIGLNLGDELKESGYALPFWFFIAILSLYFVTILAYPYFDRKKIYSPAVFYLRRKSCDGLLALSTFGMVLYLGNHPGQLFTYTGSLKAAIPSEYVLPKDSSTVKYKSLPGFYSSMKDENGKLLKWKERKKLLKEQVYSIKHADDMSKGTKTILTILSILVALALVGLVLALACNISCSGSAGGAILVGVGGIALIVFLLVLTIRGINGKKRKPKPQSPGSTGS